MKKIIGVVWFLVGLVPLASAQLSGSYTIGTSGNYTSFNAAVDDLMQQGVNGPVTFLVDSGTYYERIQLGQYVGASLSNRVIFTAANGDSTSVVLMDSATHDSTNYVVQLDGAKYVNFTHLTIRSLGIDYSRVISLVNTSFLPPTHVSFSSCWIEAPATVAQSDSNALVYLGTDNMRQINFTNNTLVNGSYGVRAAIGSNWSLFFTANTFSGQSTHNLQLGSVLDTVVCHKNRISDTLGPINPNRIAIQIADVNFHLDIQLNSVVLQDGQAMYLENCSLPPNNYAQIITNFFHTYDKQQSTSGVLGMWEVQYAELYFNTIIQSGSGMSNGAPLEIDSLQSSHLKIMNNIFLNRQGGATYFLRNNSAIELSDYNVIWSSGTTLVEGDASYSDLNAWSAARGQDSNSISVNPMFFAFDDPHTCDPAINNTGLGGVTQIAEDIDRDHRDSDSPDPGVDEFSPLTTYLQPNQLMCGNDSVRLDAGNPGSQYLWNTGETTQAIWVTNPGKYYVDLTTICTTLTDTVEVISEPKPMVTANVSTPSLCEGINVYLWGTGATYYYWNNGVNDSLPFSPPVGITTYIVTGVDTNGCSDTASVQVEVLDNPSLSANASGTDICLGDTLVLIGSGASTFTWDNGVMNGVGFVPMLGTVVYTVYGTDNFGCSDTAAVTVSVHALPNVMAHTTDTVLCQGDQLKLFGSGAVNYQWNNGVFNNSFFMPMAGTHTYTVVGTDNNGCEDTDSIEILVHPSRSAGHDSSASFVNTDPPVDLFTLLAGNPDTGGTWSDDDNSGALSGSTFKPAQPGPGTFHFTYTVTNDSPCVDKMAVVTVTVENENGISEPPATTQLQIFPNPAMNAFTIVVDGLDIKASKMELWHTNGQLVRSERLTSAIQTFTIADLPEGVYVVRVITEERSAVYKLVKQ